MCVCNSPNSLDTCLLKRLEKAQALKDEAEKSLQSFKLQCMVTNSNTTVWFILQFITDQLSDEDVLKLIDDSGKPSASVSEYCKWLCFFTWNDV